MHILETTNVFVKATPAAAVSAAFSSTLSTGLLHFGASLVVFGSGTKIADEVGDYVAKEIFKELRLEVTPDQRWLLQKFVKAITMVALQAIALYVASSLGGTLCFTVDLLSFETCFLVSMINRAAWNFFGKFYEGREDLNCSYTSLNRDSTKKGVFTSPFKRGTW